MDIQLFHGDCLEVMKDVPDKSIDLVIIDPPYVIKGGKRGGAFGRDKRSYHDELNEISNGFNDEVLKELVRVLKKINLYIFCSKAQIYELLHFFKNIQNVNYEVLTWHKTNPVPTCNNKYLSDTEYLLFFREKGVKIYGTYETKKKYYVRIRTYYCVKGKRVYSYWCKVKTGKTRK